MDNTYLVHELNQCHQIVILDIFEHNHRMLTWILFENVTKVYAAGGQKHTVGTDLASLTAQSHID